MVPTRNDWKEWLQNPCTKGLVQHFNKREGMFRQLLGSGWCMNKATSLEEVAKRYIESAAVANEYALLQDLKYSDIFPTSEDADES